MNAGQKCIIIIGLLMVVAMFLVPPWLVKPGYGAPERNAGYGLIFTPPYDTASINMPQLLLQYGVLAVVIGGLIVVNRD